MTLQSGGKIIFLAAASLSAMLLWKTPLGMAKLRKRCGEADVA